MSISDTISSVAAANPAVGVAVTTPLLAAAGSRAQEVSQLMATLQPNLGQNINTTA